MNLRNIIKLGITNIGDPFVLKAGGEYYMYATSFIDGFNCWHSKDLINWSQPVQVYKKSERSFGITDFWAPEVVEWNGKYIMHYTARNNNGSLRIGVAVSDTPMGNFVDVYAAAPMFDLGYAVIDGHVFIDGDKRYFYFDRDCSEYVVNGNNESHIFVAELDETLTKIVTEPALVAKPDQQWEKVSGDYRWNEGAFVVKRDGYYYLMYSSGFYAAPTYSLGYAVSKSPLGPFIKNESNPVLSSVKGELSGPGHNCVVKGPDNREYCVFHIHTFEDEPSQNRQACMCPIEFKAGEILL